MNELRMQRGAAVCMALTTLLVAALVPLRWEQMIDQVGGWWVPVSLVVVLASVLALLAEAIRGSGRWIGPLALMLGFSHVVALLLWLLAWRGEMVPVDIGAPPIWLANTVVLPSIGIATVYRPWVTIGYAVIAVTLLATAQQYVKQGQFGYLGYANGLLTGSLMAVFLTAVYGVMAGMRASDVHREQVLAASARTASRAARIAERHRFDDVVRDRVIASLRVVTEGKPDPRYRAIAAQTLAALEGLEESVSTGRMNVQVSAADVVLRLREAVNELGDDTMFDIQVADPDARYPYPLGEALVDASVEAVANAVQHAGAGAARGVIGAFGPDLIRIRIVDDGVGFDPQRVPSDRAGIEVGIRRRMAAQRGGGAWVESAIGDGVMVSLEWVRAT